MKTPEETKKGLNVCGTLDGDCDNCAYAGFKVFCTDRLRQDALSLIQQLEAKDAQQAQHIAELEQELAAAKRERDAAVRDLESALRTPCASECDYCARQNEPGDMCADCRFEWRGVCPENTEVQPNE